MTEELVSGDDWISDDSSFYGTNMSKDCGGDCYQGNITQPIGFVLSGNSGNEDEQQRLLSLSDHYSLQGFWSTRVNDLNFVLAKTRTMPPSDLHNVYQGRPDAWQLGESVDDFVKRLSPRTTTVAVCPWIWVANPHRDGGSQSGRVAVEDKLIPRGMELLQRSRQERDDIRESEADKPKSTMTRLLNQQSEHVKQRLADLAAETNVLSGKWMLFPQIADLIHVWRLVVEGTINNRLGSAAKIATDQGEPGARLICVYTTDFRDSKDVLRVLEELASLGLVNSGRGIYYKSDAYTYLDIYGANAAEFGLQASIYSSQKMLAAARCPTAKPAPQEKQSTLTAAFGRSSDPMDLD